MKKIQLIILLIAGVMFARAQNVSNVAFSQEGQTVVVTYDLDKAANISIAVSLDGGKTFSEPLQQVTGDVGQNVSAGKKRIVWNVLEEEEKVVSENVMFKVRANKLTINGHEYVDLGLPSGLLWATCNVGASSPSDYGDYFAWGEIETQSYYNEYNCSTIDKKISDFFGDAQYDVARKKWGDKWRMPMEREFQELEDKCTWKWTTQNGHNGYEVTGPDGNSIFLPAAGYRYGASLYLAGERGNYWSGTTREDDSQGAYGLGFGSGGHDTLWDNRNYGQSVRPVSK